MTRSRGARGTTHYLRAGFRYRSRPVRGAPPPPKWRLPAAFPALATHAIETTSDAPPVVRALRNMDLAIRAIALPLVIAAGIPILGWITGAGLYVGQRLVRLLAERKAEQADDPRTTVGLLAGSMIARGWIVAGAILAVGLTTDSDVGLSAAVLFLATFSVALTMTLATGGPTSSKKRPERPR